MKIDFRYLGHSEVRESASGTELSFEPNLARPKVGFDAQVSDPVRFREAISALHAIVIGDLRKPKKDRTAWLQWKADQLSAESDLRTAMLQQSKERSLAAAPGAPPPSLERDFQKQRGLYWQARGKLERALMLSDPQLYRVFVPYDPVITVAPDVVFFECFARDESSYGCLSVDRGAFTDERLALPGTTNVDYSFGLYDHFQTLRSYRPTRLNVDPTGFEVKVQGSGGFREEKIDLPPSWLRGFGQLQAALGLPSRRVFLDPGAVRSVLAWLVRHREKTGPRSLRFQLTPGKPVSLALDPWGTQLQGGDWNYDGEKPEEIKIWGRRRLLALERVLPLAEKIEVRLLGNGLPSIWIAHLGGMRLTLALSGWTANDWTSGAGLDLLLGLPDADAQLSSRLLAHLEQIPAASESQLSSLANSQGKTSRPQLLAALFKLAREGQVIFDPGIDKFRHRQVMPQILTEALLGPESEELSAARGFVRDNQVKIERSERLTAGRTLVVAKVANTSCEGIFEGGGAVTKARCTCTHFHKNHLRKGPCRHLIALRLLSEARA